MQGGIAMKPIVNTNTKIRTTSTHPIEDGGRHGPLPRLRWVGRQMSRRVLGRHVAFIMCQVMFAGFRFACAPAEAHGAPDAVDKPCALCAGELPVPIVPLSAEKLDSMAGARADYNAAQIALIDSLFRAGHFGSPSDEMACKKAHLLARLTMVNAYRDFVRLAGDPRCVYEATEATLAEYASRYSDVLLFSAVRLKRVRMGLGHVCLHYDVSEKGSGEVSHGGKRLRWRVKNAKIDGKKRRVLSINVPTGDHETVEVLHTPHHFFRVEYAYVEGPPAPFEWFLVYDIEGAWIKKWGTHKPSAYMFWVSPQKGFAESAYPSVALTSAAGGSRSQNTVVGSFGPEGPELTLAYVGTGPQPRVTTTSTAGIHDKRVMSLPAVPLAGLRMYIPGLRFRLPLYLPDINIDDLREIELAMPVMCLDYLKKQKQPVWLGSDENLTFGKWKGYGDVPPAIRNRFPDH
jgi:hypothetical protein